MKPIVWTRQVKISTSGEPGLSDSQLSSVSRLTLADKAAFLVLAVGLIALGAVVFATGIAVLLALLAGGLVIGGATVLRERLFGRSVPVLAPGEIAATGEVLPSKAAQPLPATPSQSLAPPGERAPRAD
jgi:hypothetical protein